MEVWLVSDPISLSKGSPIAIFTSLELAKEYPLLISCRR